MKSYEAIEKLASMFGISCREMCRRAGRHDTFFSVLKKRGSDSYAGTLASFAEACGYRLCLVPDEDVLDRFICIDPEDVKKAE